MYPETIHHLFLRWSKILIFWNNLKTLFNANINLEISLDIHELLFSYSGKTDLINYIDVLAKYYIYQNNFFSKRVDVQSFSNILRIQMLSGRYFSYVDNMDGKFFKKWLPVYDFFLLKNV